MISTLLEVQTAPLPRNKNNFCHRIIDTETGREGKGDAKERKIKKKTVMQCYEANYHRQFTVRDGDYG